VIPSKSPQQKHCHDPSVPEQGATAGPGAPAHSPQRSRLVRSVHDEPVPVLDLTDFKRDLSELTDRLGHAQDCL
jgi:peptide chain release factor 2